MTTPLTNRAYSKLIRILSRVGLAQRVSFTVPLRVGRARFAVPVIGTVGVGNVAMGDWWAVDIFLKLLPECPGAFVDVGANVGQTLLKLKSCLPEKRWIGFEPNPVCVSYLSKLIAANQLDGCTLIPAGLFAETGVMPLDSFEDDPADKTASTAKGFRPDHKIVRRSWVPVLAFSALQRAGIDDVVGFIKIDVEGAEREVLAGLHDTLKKHRPIVMVEILPAYRPDNYFRISRQEAVEQQFRDLEYRLCRIGKSADDRWVDLQPIEHIGVHDQLSHSDYIAVPSERLDAIMAMAPLA